MNRIAIFVEGQTEQVFAERLLKEVAGEKHVRIEKRKFCGGGRRQKRRMILLEASAPASGQKYFAMIVDCGEDERVKSDIRDRYDGLVKTGYQAIIGIRDVYPQGRDDIPRLRGGLGYGMKTQPIRVLFVIAIMEIEAWFIAEHTHFLRLSPILTTDRIKRQMGFDPSRDDVQLRDHPANDLHSIYQLAGHVYDKSKMNVQRTVDLLDYAAIYFDLGQKVPDLQRLTDHIDQFLSNA